MTVTDVVARIQDDARSQYEKREEEIGVEVLRELEQRVLLSVIDNKWREHLAEMDYLRAGIGLRAMGQKDPLVEYQREGYDPSRVDDPLYLLQGDAYVPLDKAVFEAIQSGRTTLR